MPKSSNEQSDAPERRSQANWWRTVNRRRPVIGDVRPAMRVGATHRRDPWPPQSTRRSPPPAGQHDGHPGSTIRAGRRRASSSSSTTSNASSPGGPRPSWAPTTQPVTRRAPRMCSRSASASVSREVGGPEDRRCFRARPAAPGSATFRPAPKAESRDEFFPRERTCRRAAAQRDATRARGKPNGNRLPSVGAVARSGDRTTRGWRVSCRFHASVDVSDGAARCRCSLRAGWPWAVITRNGVDRLERVRFLPNVALSADGNLPDSSRCVNSDLKRSQKQAQPQPRRQRTFPRTSIRRHAIRGHAEQALQVRQRRRYQK